jgi:16S rRNA G966 N2-methylase RsmD
MGTLYYGDNLDILRRYLKDESVDLVYLDPPAWPKPLRRSVLQLRAEQQRLLSGKGRQRRRQPDSRL